MLLPIGEKGFVEFAVKLGDVLGEAGLGVVDGLVVEGGADVLEKEVEKEVGGEVRGSRLRSKYCWREARAAWRWSLGRSRGMGLVEGKGYEEPIGGEQR